MNVLYTKLIILFFASIALGQPDTLWTQVFSPLARSEATDVIQTSDGGFVFSGSAAETTAYPKLWVLKTDQNGIQEWEIYWGDSTFNSSANDLLRTSDGNFLVAVDYLTPTGSAGRFLKLNNSGDILWSSEFSDFEENWINECSSTSDGGYICCGSAGTYPGMDGLLLKLDHEGNTEWSVTLDKPPMLILQSVFQTPDGGYIAAGYINYSSTQSQLYIVRTDSEGNSLWEQILGDSSVKNLSKTIRPTADGGFMLSAARIASTYRQLLIKLSDSGIVEWESLWEASDNAANKMELASDGNLLLTGATADGSTANLWLAKINSDGDIIWETVVENDYPTGGMCLMETNDYGYIVGATYQPYGATMDTWLVRFAAPEGIETDPTLTTTSIVSISPNPSSSEMSIGYNVAGVKNIRIEIYDLSGRLITTILDDQVSSGYHTYSWNPGSEVTTGCYLIVLESENGIYVEKCLRID